MGAIVVGAIAAVLILFWVLVHSGTPNIAIGGAVFGLGLFGVGFAVRGMVR